MKVTGLETWEVLDGRLCFACLSFSSLSTFPSGKEFAVLER